MSIKSIITVGVEDAEAAWAALSPFLPQAAPAATPLPTPGGVATPAPLPPTASSVSAQIEATSLSQGLTTLGALYASLSAKASALPAGTILAIEDVAGLIDPALIPDFGAIQAIAPIVTAAFAALAAGQAAPGNYWLGEPRAI